MNQNFSDFNNNRNEIVKLCLIDNLKDHRTAERICIL